MFGQALGGHKRCHYDGGIGGGVVVAMSTTLSSVHKGFDLNLPAMVVEKEEEEEKVLSPLAKPRLMIFVCLLRKENYSLILYS